MKTLYLGKYAVNNFSLAFFMRKAVYINEKTLYTVYINIVCRCFEFLLYFPFKPMTLVNKTQIKHNKTKLLLSVYIVPMIVEK